MLTETQINRYFERCKVGADAIAYIRNTRNSQPARMVGAHAHTNICSWVYSEKMQRTISTESRTAERAFMVLSEFDSDVLEIWDQPEPVPVHRHTRNGLSRNSSYTPDFLLLRENGPCVIEVKNAAAVEKLIVSAPKDWVR